MANRASFRFQGKTLGALFSFSSLLVAGCSSAGSKPSMAAPVSGQTEFQSASPNAGANRGGSLSASAPGAAAAPGTPSTNASAQDTSAAAPRTVEETDLYRLEGDRLYYLNAYRGLMVFDVSNVDDPKLLGRSPIYGSPVEMIVRNGVASVVVADWYGTDELGKPFYGSIVRGIDATDPTKMKILGDARLGGWVRDTRVVGDVLYAVTEDYGYSFGGYAAGISAGIPGGYGQSSVSVASVNIAGGSVVLKGNYQLPGQGGVFNVTPNSILLAHSTSITDVKGIQTPTGQTELVYIDISDPEGTIRARGSVSFTGSVQGWGADNGRWNLDFADGKIAHALATSGQYYDYNQPLVLATADFTQPDSPTISSLLQIPATGWSAAARFDSGRMYLSPGSNGYYYGGQAQPALPLQIYDLSDPQAPDLAGATSLTGEVWNLIPAGNRLFALGNEYTPGDQNFTSSQVSLRYLDVTNAAAPSLLGTSKFGDGWAWTPAAGTFKAFTMDKDKGLVVLPFSGWDNASYTYNNGLQLIEFDDQSLQTAGASHTKGWVERGIFVGPRLVSLSDLALSVVDYTDKTKPQVVTELTLSRNVVNVRPLGDSVAELSSDWWGNDVDHSTLRIVPTSQVEENVSGAASAEVDIAGQNAQSFHNGSLAYIVSTVCATPDAAGSGAAAPSGKANQCQAWTQEVQVVDYSLGTIEKRGVVRLPNLGNYYSYYGGTFYGCFYYDWYNGSDVVQVAGDALAFRRWSPNYAADGQYIDSQQSLFLVDLSNPDAPSVASTAITNDPNGWWGNMRAVGNELYTSHYEWDRPASYDNNAYDPGVVRYFLDRIDYSDRKNPHVGQKINVPGMLIGASDTDPSLIYTLDYRWNGTDININDFDVLKLSGDHAYLQGSVALPGWVGNTFVRGNKAYMSSQVYDSKAGTSTVNLVELDVSDPQKPTLSAAPAQQGWGWLVGVEGDRALVSSGWSNQGIDVYQLSDTGAPSYDQFIRTRGWGVSSLSRQGNQLFLSSGYWGTQVVDLGH